MALRSPTDEETQKIIHSSVGVVFTFNHGPENSQFLDEVISWKDILNIPSVTKIFLHTTTLVATKFVIPGGAPAMSRKIFFRHLDQTEEETVEEYRDFLKDLIFVEEA
jgi:hypothetical protein